MKKTYLNSFCARCLTLLVLALMSTNLAWGAEKTITLTHTNWSGNTSYSTSEQTLEQDGITFGYINAMENGSNGTPTGWAKSQIIQTRSGYIYNTDEIKNITNVTISIVTNTNSFTLNYGATSECLSTKSSSDVTASTKNVAYTKYENKKETTGQTTTANVYSFDLSNEKPSYIKFACGSKAVYIYDIVITYEEVPAGPVDPTITFEDGQVSMGKTLDLSTLFDSNSTGAITYEITDNTDGDGSIEGSIFTPSKAGFVEITATQAAVADKFNQASEKAIIEIVSARTLTGIALSGTYETEFWKGDVFKHDGIIVTASFDGAEDAVVTDDVTFSVPDMATSGEKTITVSYTYEDVTKTVDYTINVKSIANTSETAYTVAKAKELIDAGKDLTTPVYVKGTVSQIVTEWTSQYGNITFDVSADGKTTGQQFRFYRNFKGADKTKWASAEECPTVGDDVIGLGNLTKFGDIYEFAESNYIVSRVKATTLEIQEVRAIVKGSIINPVIKTNRPEGYTISYSSSDETVVAIVEGKLTAVGVGETNVKASLEATEGYKAVETTFRVSVIPAFKEIQVKTPPTKVVYKENETFDPTGLEITLIYDGSDPTIVKYADNPSAFTFLPSTTTPLLTTDNKVTITYSGKSVDQEITVNPLDEYTITWMANGVQFKTTTVIENQHLTLPETEPTAPAGMKFMGWIAEKSYSDAATAPTYIDPTTITPSADATYYAVFATEVISGKASLTKMKSDETLTDGDKIVIVANYNNEEKSYALYQKTTNTSYVSKYEFDGEINSVLADDKNWLSVNKTEKGFSLGDDTNGYIYSSNNNLYCGETEQTWTLKDLEDGTFKIQSDGRNLSYRGDLSTKYWRMGGASYGISGQTALQIYKISESSTSYLDYTTSYVTIASSGYSSFSSTYAVTIPEDITAYYATGVNGNKVSMVAIEEDVIPANTGVVIKGKAGKSYTFVETVSTDVIEGNCLIAVSEKIESLAPEVTTDNVVYKNYVFTGGQFHPFTSGATVSVGAGKAYLQIEKPFNPNAKLEMCFGDVTGINTIDNGQLTIDNSKAYNLNGVRVNPSTGSGQAYKGIVIMNGKKYISK